MANKYDPEILREKLEILDGSRGSRTADAAAVRIRDLGAILRVAQQRMKAEKVSVAPTAAEYNALLDDVAKLTACLVEVAQALQARVL